MASVLVNDQTVELTVACQMQGQYALNVYHFHVDNKIGPGITDADFADTFDSQLGPLYRALLPANCSYYGVKAQVIRPTRLDSVVDRTNTGAGAVAGDMCPAQVAGVVSLRSGIASRAARGRVYFPTSSESINTATGAPAAAYITAVDTICASLLPGGTIVVGAGSMDWSWQIYSRSLNTTFRVQAYLVRTNWGTIRRRSQIGQTDAAPF